MERIKLSNRLQAIANLVLPGAKVADIGTDHGYIPVWLTQQKIADKIAAADINRGPLQHAINTADEFGVRNQIQFELCNGLDFSNSSEYDTVIIAGMGGELISSILEAAPWTKANTRLILQPNSRIPVLVEWLISSGYCIEQAQLVKDAGKIYQILVVTGGQTQPIEEEANRLVHQLYFDSHDPLLSEYLDILLRQYTSAEKGMLSGKSESPDLARVQRMIELLTSMKGKVNTWQQ